MVESSEVGDDRNVSAFSLDDSDEALDIDEEHDSEVTVKWKSQPVLQERRVHWTAVLFSAPSMDKHGNDVSDNSNVLRVDHHVPRPIIKCSGGKC